MRVSAQRMFLRRHAIGLIGLTILVCAATAAILAPWIAPYSPTKVDLLARLSPPAWVEGGSMKHLLGTDNLGRDTLSRVIYGARISLAVGAGAVVLGALIGSVIGLLAGYFGGLVDAVLSFLINVQLSFPFHASRHLPAGHVRRRLCCRSWWSWRWRPGSTTHVSCAGQMMSVKNQEYVEAARSVGVPTNRILRRYILPNILSSIIVVASFSMAQAILTEAALSFLGVGIGGATPSWGTMLNDGRNYLQNAWWMTAMPGIATALTVLAGNLCGDWLQDRTDPRLRK